MATRAEGWAALRDGLGPAWLVVGALAVAGFWTVHEPGAAWTTILSGRAAGFLVLAALATLWAADWLVRYVLDADPVWLRQTMRFGWALLLVLAVPVAATRHLLEPDESVALAAGHLWLSSLAAVAAALLWFHDAAERDAGRRFYLATAATAAALAVWSAQAGIMGGPTDRSLLLVAWLVTFALLGAFWLGARLAGRAGAEPEAAPAPPGVPRRPPPGPEPGPTRKPAPEPTPERPTGGKARAADEHPAKRT